MKQATEATTTMTEAPARARASVQLQEPIVRGAQRIETLAILRPRTADLRGLALTELLQMKADTVAAVLPRITEPSILRHEVDAMDPADLLACAVEVTGFLVPKAVTASQAE
ncbi:phage tail assembly protein [Acidovorax sp. HDW3]|uniref:phage tail assembly protein n=1 Tax=Acidovorax sp. HDW3 TaxID=2714923 RepID=UPI00197A995D|nr:phage tail assembly protein [Acidovorax sp. HDW3]